ARPDPAGPPDFQNPVLAWRCRHCPKPGLPFLPLTRNSDRECVAAPEDLEIFSRTRTDTRYASGNTPSTQERAMKTASMSGAPLRFLGLAAGGLGLVVALAASAPTSPPHPPTPPQPITKFGGSLERQRLDAILTRTGARGWQGRPCDTTTSRRSPRIPAAGVHFRGGRGTRADRRVHGGLRRGLDR